MAKKEEIKEELTKEDHQLLIDIIEAASQRGAVLGKELTPFGYIFDKLTRIHGNN